MDYFYPGALSKWENKTIWAVNMSLCSLFSVGQDKEFLIPQFSAPYTQPSN